MAPFRPAETQRAQDELLLLLAHELRNPVHALSTALDVFDAAPPGSATSDEARDVLRRQGVRLTELMDELLAVARVLTGRAPLARTPCDLCALVDAELAALPPGKVRKAAIAPAHVIGDTRWLRHALVGVLAVAAQRSYDGLDVQVLVRDGHALLMLHGAGPADQGPARASMADPPELKLLMAERLLALHGGTLEQGGKGAAIRWQVALPLAAQVASLPGVTPRQNFEPE